METPSAELDKFRNFMILATNPNSWTKETVGKLIQISLQYAKLFQNQDSFNDYIPVIKEYISNEEEIRYPPAFLIHCLLFYINSGFDLKVGVAFFNNFFSIVPDGRSVASQIVSQEIGESNTKRIIEGKIQTDFIPFVNLHIGCFDFEALPVDVIVEYALSDDEAMKAVLSSVVPRIIASDPKAFQVIQRIAALPGGEPAIVVAKELKIRHHIACFLSDSL